MTDEYVSVRYIVIPSAAPAERWDLHLLAALYPTVYEDDEVRVVENRDALPRAWIVHEAVMSSRAGIVDTRRTAVLETEPPPLAQPADPTADDVAVMSYASDRIRLKARSSAPGLVVLSDTYDAGWRAYVDGEPAPVLVANYALVRAGATAH